MALDKLETALDATLTELNAKGTLKGKEKVITGFRPKQGGHGPRYYLAGQGKKEFLKMNSNSYLGLSFHPEVIKAEMEAAEELGVGPGAVRFISGTFQPHVQLEEKLAEFHHRQAAMIFSAAYAAVMGILPQFITKETIVISDELNHNCIISAIRLSRPATKAIYRHLDMADLKAKLTAGLGRHKRALVVTDGIFSMRGDHAPLDAIDRICAGFHNRYEEGVITVVDDSHGVGAFGDTGRGVEEYTNTKADILVATLGKALGVNGGYVVASRTVIEYLRETAPFYIYSNPITQAEAAAAMKALQLLAGAEGLSLLARLRKLVSQFTDGLSRLGYETIAGETPIVPLMVRDTRQTSALVDFLFRNGILATGLNYPVVPKGDEEIRFQISAAHTEDDISYALNVLQRFKGDGFHF